MKPRASELYEVRWSHRHGTAGLIDGIVDVAESLVSGWGGPDAPNSATVAICEKGGREVARMRVSGVGARGMYDRVQADLDTMSAADFEREWGITT
jgi:hypothetical protein